MANTQPVQQPVQLNAKVVTASVTQSANELLGMETKTLYYLVIETQTGKLQINVGKKTHDEVLKITAK